MKTARKITALVLTLMMLLGTLAAGTVTASAENSGTCGKNGGDVRWSLNPETGVLTISGKGEMEDYNFADLFASDFYPGWYDVKNTITSVVIENGVESIGFGAFWGCESLTSITIPSSVTSIGFGAFYSCSSLTSITIPSSVTSIGVLAFAGCESLTSITIPSSVTSIGYGAFDSCSSLTSITIPSSVTSIGEAAFAGCASLSEIKVDSANNSFCTVDGVLFSKDKKTLVCYPAGKQGMSYTIPSSVTSIEYGAFADCPEDLVIKCEKGSAADTYAKENGITVSYIGGNGNPGGTCGKNGDDVRWSLNPETGVLTISGKGEMENYNFNDSIPGWYDYAEDITSVIIENGVESIGDVASYFCPGWYDVKNIITSVVIENDVESIGDWAFAYCDSLTSITIPSSVTSIGKRAFDSCSSLTSITIPSSVTSIGYKAFARCASLSEIKVDSANNSFCTVDGVLFSKDKKTLVCYPAGKQGTSYTIPSSVTSIGFWAFAYCDSLTSVTIPSSVTGIAKEAFIFCSKDLVINCVPGSAADTYARICNINTNYTCDVMPDSIGTKSSAYKVDVTVSVPVKAPAGAEVWIDGSKAEGSNGRYSKHIGQLESDKSITVRIKYDGNVLETSSVKVTVDSGFFAKIASFFSNFLFNGFKWKSETINF